MSPAARLGGKRAKHWRKIELCTEARDPIRVRWFVVECKCGWSSPLCPTRGDADRLYDRHRRARDD